MAVSFTASVPEPGTVPVLGAALIGLAVASRRSRLVEARANA